MCRDRRRRRRRDATVELSRVEVFTRRAVHIEFATSSRRLLTDLVENLETEHVENLSYRVELCRRCVLTHRLSRSSLQFCSHKLWPQNYKLSHDCRWVGSHRRHDATRLRCRQICSDSSRLSPTVCRQLYTHRRCDSTHQLRRVGAAVCIGLLVKWSLRTIRDKGYKNTFAFVKFMHRIL